MRRRRTKSSSRSEPRSVDVRIIELAIATKISRNWAPPMSKLGVIPHRLGGGEAGSTSYLRAGHGEPLVLIHGVGMNASIWTPQIEALRNDFDFVAYDMLGHGGSSR